MKKSITPILISLITLIGSLAQAKSDAISSQVERGRYLIKITGCNDCHTPQYGLKGGDVPEKDWLIGDPVGWKGPWGVTYPTNLRVSVHNMKEKEFINYAKNLKARPPMPWYSLKSMSDQDLAAIYHFIKSLGPNANIVPAAVAPGAPVKGPFMDMTVR